jgi:3D (Asp-Asp-Asp) domain-containing protein
MRATLRTPRRALALLALLPLAACALRVGAPPASLPPPEPAGIPAPPLPEGVPPVVAEVEVAWPEAPAPVAISPAADALPVARRLDMRATAYCLRGNMRTGVRVRDGMAAGDPAVLPLGSVVRVSHPDGRVVGIFVIMDTGSAVRGNKIDLWFASCAEARQWGIRTVVAEVIRIGRS